MAHHGHPLLGDRKYGSGRTFAAGIALHARRLAIAHPVGGQPLSFEASLPLVGRLRPPRLIAKASTPAPSPSPAKQLAAAELRRALEANRDNRPLAEANARLALAH